MRVLGIDYGDKKIGLAMGDASIKVASPFEVWQHLSDLEAELERIATFVKKEGFDVVVVGAPLSEDGSVSERAQKHLDFAKSLQSRMEIPVHVVNERLTSKESQRMAKDAGSNVEEDAIAAMLILQEYFEDPDSGRLTSETE